LNIVLSLDYEIFFGRQAGTVERTLLAPTEALRQIAKYHRLPLVFFVDAGFLLRLKEEGQRFPGLMRDYDQIMRQLEGLVVDGHEIQLHVHPHWEDSFWNGESWNINLQRYRLQDFENSAISEIVTRYTNVLRTITGDRGVFAYRAGGWVIQPFSAIQKALKDEHILIDSTIFRGGIAKGATHRFDFSNAPAASHWFFDDDPLECKPYGKFLEVPIASYRLSPLFYWRFAIRKKLGSSLYRQLGDGHTIPLSRSDLVRKLSCWTVSTVSIDGSKASILEDAYKQYERAGMSDFVVIGHPKALSRFSLERLKNFISKRKVEEFVGYKNYLTLFNGV